MNFQLFQWKFLIFSCYDLIFSCPEKDRKMTNRYPCIIHLIKKKNVIAAAAMEDLTWGRLGDIWARQLCTGTLSPMWGGQRQDRQRDPWRKHPGTRWLEIKFNIAHGQNWPVRHGWRLPSWLGTHSAPRPLEPRRGPSPPLDRRWRLPKGRQTQLFRPGHPGWQTLNFNYTKM